jgi:hypothetical protein
MPSFLLIELSNRSPTVPEIANTTPIINPSLNWISTNLGPIRLAKRAAKTIEPAKP